LKNLISQLRVHILQRQVITCQGDCQTLMEQFEITPSAVERTEIADRLSAALKRLHAFQLLLEFAQRKDKRRRFQSGFQPIKGRECDARTQVVGLSQFARGVFETPFRARAANRKVAGKVEFSLTVPS
jgi:hypothetical protein